MLTRNHLLGDFVEEFVLIYLVPHIGSIMCDNNYLFALNVLLQHFGLCSGGQNILIYCVMQNPFNFLM